MMFIKGSLLVMKSIGRLFYGVGNWGLKKLRNLY